MSICYDDKLFNSYLLFLSFQLVDLDAIVAPTEHDINPDVIEDDVSQQDDVMDPQQEDFVDHLLGGQDSPMDLSLEVPECGVCTSMSAVNGKIGVYIIIILLKLL